MFVRLAYKRIKYIYYMLQAETQKEGQEPEKQTGYKAIVNWNYSNGTTAPSQKSFPAQV
jgi:hypothetical protein